MKFGSDGPALPPKEIIKAFGMNVCSAVGRLGADAEIRGREGGRMARCRIAVDDSYLKTDGSRVERNCGGSRQTAGVGV